MTLWHPIEDGIWQGRDDRAESPLALRLFQTITRAKTFAPHLCSGELALIGFACDVGVRRNRGRPGAMQGPNALRCALANMASHPGHERLLDVGNIRAEGEDLESAQQALHDTVLACQLAGKKTLVFGGGHETAFPHGTGVLAASGGQKVAIVNLDAHLDLRSADCATSGTPFRQLAHYCAAQGQTFNYFCLGASRAANTQALWQEAERLGATVLEDLSLLDADDPALANTLAEVIRDHDKIYLTIDLDVLPAWEMPAVSAPASPGIPLALILRIATRLCQSGKLQAVDLVEFNPQYDRDGVGARTAARLAWHIVRCWQ